MGAPDYWLRVSMMWRSLQIDEDFRWITASEICIILHIIWKPLLILGWRNVQMSDYHCSADAVILNVTTSVAPSSQGTGYSGFQVTGMLECGQKSTLPPPRKKPNRVSNKTPKIPAQKLTPPPKKKNIYIYPYRILVRAFLLTTLETPKNIFCFITDIMQNDNFRLFWIRKKIPT